MSSPTTTLSAGDFDDFEFGLIVADFDTEQTDPRVPPRRRMSRSVEELEAINESLGIYRHRTSERRN
jgi:hypothetical protein